MHGLRRQSSTLIRHQKERESLKTAGMWPWKSAPSQKCVTTYLPKTLASKIDGAQACGREPAGPETSVYVVGPSRRTWGPCTERCQRVEAAVREHAWTGP